MFFRQFYLESLGHASYLVGDEETGKALVFDPQRNVESYFAAARSQGLQIAYALDSHGHNDYLSGLTELKQRTELDILGFHEAGIGYDHRAIKDGEFIEFGDVGIEVIHTPGHTPEHVSLVVYDRAQGDEPALLLSGGALLVGDIARPDLLGGPEEAHEMARVFCHTIQEKLLFNLPDHLEVFPTHVAGSLCGANIGNRLSTTMGYERKTNAILSRISSSEEFIDECLRLDDLPAVPPYWRRMRKQNMAGVAPLGTLREPDAIGPSAFEAAKRDGFMILDVRSPEAFGGTHIEGALNVELGSSFPTWVGTIVPDDADVIVVLDDPDDLPHVVWEMLRIGYKVPKGWLAGGMFAWRTSGKPTVSLTQLTVHELNVRRQEFEILDVRQPGEWSEGHIDGAIFITGAELPERIDEVPERGPLAVICGSGFRSSSAASLLKHHGRDEIFSVIGGSSAWDAAGYETVS